MKMLCLFPLLMNLQTKELNRYMKFQFGEVGVGLLGQNKWKMHLKFSNSIKTLIFGKYIICYLKNLD